MEISLNNSLNKVVNTPDTEVLAAERDNILVEIKKVKCDLADAYNNFDYVDDSLMIDYYTYLIKAFETRFEYLIKKAKAIGISDL
jgi:hypothetical protein